MSVDDWVTLWTVLLWVSAGAFGLVTIYVLCGFVRRLSNFG